MSFRDGLAGLSGKAEDNAVGPGAHRETIDAAFQLARRRFREREPRGAAGASVPLEGLEPRFGRSQRVLRLAVGEIVRFGDRSRDRGRGEKAFVALDDRGFVRDLALLLIDVGGRARSFFGKLEGLGARRGRGAGELRALEPHEQSPSRDPLTFFDENRRDHRGLGRAALAAGSGLQVPVAQDRNHEIPVQDPGPGNRRGRARAKRNRREADGENDRADRGPARDFSLRALVLAAAARGWSGVTHGAERRRAAMSSETPPS